MTQPVSERELLESQIKTYEFYARLIDRAVGGRAAAIMPKWDEQRAEEYSRLASELRARLAALDEKAAVAPAVDPDGERVAAPATGNSDTVPSAVSK